MRAKTTGFSGIQDIQDVQDIRDIRSNEGSARRSKKRTSARRDLYENDGQRVANNVRYGWTPRQMQVYEESALAEHISPKDLALMGVTLDSEEDVQKIIRLKDSLGQTNGSIDEFGKEMGVRNVQLSDSLLASAKAAAFAEDGKKISELVVMAGRVANTAFGNDQRSKLPILGPILDRMRGLRSDFVRDSASVTMQMERLNSEIDQINGQLREREQTLEGMLTSVKEDFRDLGTLLAASSLVLEQWRGQAAKWEDEVAAGAALTPDQSIELREIKHLILRLDKRRGNLLALQQAAAEAVPQIMVMQENNRGLLEALNEAKVSILPSVNRSLGMRVVLQEQKDVADVVQKMQEINVSLLKSNADLLNTAVQDIARINSAPIFNMEDLRYVSNKTESAIQEFFRIHSEGAKLRANMEKQIMTMREQSMSLLIKQDVGRQERIRIPKSDSKSISHGI